MATKRLLNSVELCQWAGISTRHLARLRAQGLPVIHLGRSARFDPDAVMEWLQLRERHGRGGRPRKPIPEVTKEAKAD